MKKVRKKNNMVKRARAGVKGLIVSWQDKDPLRNTTANINGSVTHRNRQFRLCAEQVFNDFGHWITQLQQFRWLITITVVFAYDNGQDQHEIRELEAFATISEINEYSLDAIRDAMRHGDMSKYTHTEFVIECIDTADRKSA